MLNIILVHRNTKLLFYKITLVHNNKVPDLRYFSVVFMFSGGGCVKQGDRLVKTKVPCIVIKTVFECFFFVSSETMQSHD